jgi:hypothetical protein
MAIKMTREEYQQIYGQSPVISGAKPQTQPQQAAPVYQDINPERPRQDGSDYFSYGSQSEIDQMLGDNPGTQMLYSKAGGLATPLFAGGGQTRYGRYAGGGLNVVEHSGKARNSKEFIIASFCRLE